LCSLLSSCVFPLGIIAVPFSSASHCARRVTYDRISRAARCDPGIIIGSSSARREPVAARFSQCRRVLKP
jgi:hypothetical protein